MSGSGSGYLPVNSTYSSSVYHGQLPYGFAEVGKNCNLDEGLGGAIKITPQADYVVGVHPYPFGYYVLQHGLPYGARTVPVTRGNESGAEPTKTVVNGAYFGINSAYNGPCSYAAYRPCAGNTVVNSLSDLPR